MISILICSINPARFDAVRKMYAAALGNEPFELIGIHDAKSLAEGYMRALQVARGEIIIFSHDDIEILNDQFPQRIFSHLSGCDMFGVAGTDLLVGPNWMSAGPPHLLGQVAHTQPDGSLVASLFSAPRPLVLNVQALDGLFIAAKRAVVNHVSFDPVTFDGFHLYDLDFSYSAFRSGIKLGIAMDINILHASVGNYNQVWAVYAERFLRKWAGKLPPFNIRQFAWATVLISNKMEALELMKPFYWDQ
ncbi:MAG: glycosyltransferase family protein [Planctomycetota bacterium]|nr:glycosyltransferase family protein [Planctomycetota bacterium]